MMKFLITSTSTILNHVSINAWGIVLGLSRCVTCGKRLARGPNKMENTSYIPALQLPRARHCDERACFILRRPGAMFPIDGFEGRNIRGSSPHEQVPHYRNFDNVGEPSHLTISFQLTSSKFPHMPTKPGDSAPSRVQCLCPR